MRVTERVTELSQRALDARRRCLCSSDVPAILGVSPFKSAMDVWMEKIVPEHCYKGRKRDSQAMYLGRLIEPLILDWAAERVGLSRYKRNIWRIWKEDPRFGATLDGAGRLDSDYVIIEAKSAGLASFRGASGWGSEDDGNNGIPSWVMAQCMHQMLVTDTRSMYVAALVAGLGMRLYRIEATSKQVFRLYDFCRDWWHEYIEKQQAPEAERVEHSLLTDLELEINDRPLRIEADLGRQVLDVHQQITELRRSLRQAEQKRDVLLAGILARMADKGCGSAWAELGEGGGVLMIEHRTVERKAYQVPASRYNRTRIRVITPEHEGDSEPQQELENRPLPI